MRFCSCLPLGLVRRMASKAVLLVSFCIMYLGMVQTKPPNIVFILTDDQDAVLGGMNPMTKTRKLIGDAGIVFDNMYVSSPLCCPSRSSILTAKYNHNFQALNNSIEGNCSSPAWQATQENDTFVTQLKQLQYRTFFAGKYLNQYGKKKAGGVQHVPPGWDSWHGLVGNSVYYNYTLSANGQAEKHGDDYHNDYLTNVIQRKALKFLKHRKLSKPFFMMLSTPACHSPFTPAPEYSANFSDVKAPRNGSFNVYGKDKHWLVRNAKHPLSKDAIEYIDKIYKDRWRTLLSVDDMVESVIKKIEEMGELDNTYFFYTSDNGYHMGQFSLIYDKRHLYETDIKVPFMVRGPGIKPNQTRKEMVMTVDLGPTFIELAGARPPVTMDGMSIKPLLMSVRKLGYKPRIAGLIEHVGEYASTVDGCPQYKGQNMFNCEVDCVCNDSKNNTYACLRVVSPTDNVIICQFSDSQDFMEVYDLSKDPHQLDNIASTINPEKLVDLNKRLIQLMVCSGVGCHGDATSNSEWRGPK